MEPRTTNSCATRGNGERGKQTDKPETDTDGVLGCMYRIADCMYLFFSLVVCLLADQVWAALVRVVSLLVCPSTRACLILALLAEAALVRREASSRFYFIFYISLLLLVMCVLSSSSGGVDVRCNYRPLDHHITWRCRNAPPSCSSFL